VLKFAQGPWIRGPKTPRGRRGVFQGQVSQRTQQRRALSTPDHRRYPGRPSAVRPRGLTRTPGRFWPGGAHHRGLTAGRVDSNGVVGRVDFSSKKKGAGSTAAISTAALSTEDPRLPLTAEELSETDAARLQTRWGFSSIGQNVMASWGKISVSARTPHAEAVFCNGLYFGYLCRRAGQNGAGDVAGTRASDVSWTLLRAGDLCEGAAR